MKSFSVFQKLIEPLFREDAEAVGDLYLDVADAFTENGKFF